MTHICVSKLTIISSDNGLSPSRHQAIIWTNAIILLTGPVRTNFSEILSEIHTFSFNKMHLKISYGKWRPFCLGLNVSSLVTLALRQSLDCPGANVATIIHCGLVKPYSDIDLGQHWLGLWLIRSFRFPWGQFHSKFEIFFSNSCQIPQGPMS